MDDLVLNLVHARNFHSEETVNNILNVIRNQKFQETQYGYEIPNFNLLSPDLDRTFSRVLNEPIIVDPTSGVFRQSMSAIHFESFESTKEWCFAVALEKVLFNTYEHKSGAKTALDGYGFNYKNLFEWEYTCHIQLEPGQGIFFRPWVFHSFSNGIIQHFKMSANRINMDKKIILIMGLPGSGKTTLSEKLTKELNATHINADVVRKMYNDWDFSYEGRERQANRMRQLAVLSNNKYTIIDMICPRISTRDILNPDFIIWMDTIKEGRFQDTNEMFESPQYYNIRINDLNYSVQNIIQSL